MAELVVNLHGSDRRGEPLDSVGDAEIKHRYDPENVFHRNHNIVP